MFDRQFFSVILPQHVRDALATHRGRVPVLELHLIDRTVLDLCHIVRLADGWVAVAYFCREDAWDDYDLAFIPYATIARVTLTLRDTDERAIGFRADQEPIETPSEAQPQIVPASAASE